MSKISLKPNASGTGVFTLEAPNSNVDRTLNLPDENGTLGLSDKISEGNSSVEVVDTGTGRIEFTTDGSEAMRIDENGNTRMTNGDINFFDSRDAIDNYNGEIRWTMFDSTSPKARIVAERVVSNNRATSLKFYTASGVPSSSAALRMTIANDGSVTIVGSLSKGSGSFKIDHPLKPETHHLVHSFIEGPQADNIYRGKVDLVDGTATVNIDTVAGMTEGTFDALNREVQCFTSNESGWTAVRGSVSGNILTIEAQDNTCTDTISWMVVGERKDQHMYDTKWTDENGKVIVEPEKVIQDGELE